LIRALDGSVRVVHADSFAASTVVAIVNVDRLEAADF